MPKLSPPLGACWHHHTGPSTLQRQASCLSPLYHHCQLRCVWYSKIFLEQKTWVLVPNFLCIWRVWAFQFSFLIYKSKYRKALKGKSTLSMELDLVQIWTWLCQVCVTLGKSLKVSCLGSLFAELNNLHQVANCLLPLKFDCMLLTYCSITEVIP